jgi:hypothetical protein
VKYLYQLIVATTLLFSATVINAEEKAPESVRKLAIELKAWSEDAALVTAVEDQNAQNLSLDTIKKRDAGWRATSGIDDFMKLMMENTAAKELHRLEETAPYFVELFLMDNQGANVAMTNKTSDYWQGDEAKFTESFNKGEGAVHLSAVEFDESAQAYLVQVSVPVMKDGAAIGALTIGVNVDILEGQ